MFVRITWQYVRVMRTKSPALVPLFRSDLQARLLAVLLLGAHEEMTAAELQERLGASRTGVHQELRRLLDAGVLERRSVGRTALYRPARDSPILGPLTELVQRTIGVESELRRRLAEIPGIEAAAIYGSWAAGTRIAPTSDVDVLVIGQPDPDQLEHAVRAVERLSGREVNLTLYDRADWLERLERGSGFAATVLDRTLIRLHGDVPGARQ
jgi:DNA-binding transcriptional ArsR family regulator